MPTEKSKQRRLAAIMFTDVVGYTGIMENNETVAMQMLQSHEKHLKSLLAANNGTLIQIYGDGSLSLFNSVHDALACARDLQVALQGENAVPLRIGIHIGEVVENEGRVYGDGVNVASRIESSGYAGIVLMSADAFEKVRNQGEFNCRSMGRFRFKNVSGTMELYALVDEALPAPDPAKLKNRYRPSVRSMNRGGTTVLVLLILAVIAGIAYALMRSDGSEGRANASGLTPVAVFPIDVRGNAQLEYLREGLVDVLSSKIDGVAGFTAIDPNIAISESREMKEISDPMDYSGVARSLGASQFILGTLTQFGSDLRLKVTQYSSDVEILAQAEVVMDSEDGILDGVDELIKQTVAENLTKQGQELTSVQVIYSHDMEALKEFLSGEEQRRRGDYASASRRYSAALDIDSTMALAWLRLWSVCQWNYICPDVQTDLLAKARLHSRDLPQKTQDFIDAWYEFNQERSPESIQVVRALMDKYGESVDLLVALGEVIFHTHVQRGEMANEALDPFLKAFEYDAGNTEVLNHVTQILVYQGKAQKLLEIRDRLPYDSYNWAIFTACYLITRDEGWSVRELVEMLESPGFDITSLFIRARTEKYLLEFIELFYDLKRLNGAEFLTPYVPVQDLVYQFEGKDSLAILEDGEASGNLLPYLFVLLYPETFEWPEFMDAPEKIFENNTGPEIFPENLMRALLAIRMGDLEKFELNYNKYKEESSQWPTAARIESLARARLLRKAGQFESANEVIDSALYAYIPSQNGTFRYFISSALLLDKCENLASMGAYEEALRWYEIMFNIIDAGEDGLIPYSWLRRAEINEKLERWSEAQKYYNDFLTIYENADPHYNNWIRRAEEGRRRTNDQLK